jgi:hypothetical protein
MAGFADAVEIAAGALQTGDVLLIDGLEYRRGGGVEGLGHSNPDGPLLIDALLDQVRGQFRAGIRVVNLIGLFPCPRHVPTLDHEEVRGLH